MTAETVGDKSLERSDGNRRIDIAAATRRLAGRATNPPADRSQRIRAPRDQISVFKAPFGNGTNIAAGVGVDRAGVLALDLPLPIVDVGNFDFDAVTFHGQRSLTGEDDGDAGE